MSWRSMLMATAVAEADPELAVGAPDTTEVTDGDVEEIRALVRRQLAAFRTGRAADAYGLCSQGIRETFTSPAQLLDTIKAHYPALVAHRQLVFGDFLITPDGLAVILDLVGEDYAPREALYLVQRDAGGAWRVNGCMMTEDEPRAALAA